MSILDLHIYTYYLCWGEIMELFLFQIEKLHNGAVLVQTDWSVTGMWAAMPNGWSSSQESEHRVRVRGHIPKPRVIAEVTAQGYLQWGMAGAITAMAKCFEQPKNYCWA